ncbi:VanZ family protein [Weissella confusa]|uniref:VanZ family protein n=1 Tax=Weissella confusa TaxID=1583 RepID=A0A923SNW4_WEICO|nr:VanZ family protein [Weissella confusa]
MMVGFTIYFFPFWLQLIGSTTMGGVIGWIFAPLLGLIFPSRDRMDERARSLGHRVTLVRRLLSFGVDFVIASIIGFILNQIVPSQTTQAAFNVLLTVPFGMYLHFYFKRGFFTTLILTMMLTAFYETTQYTALYHIYCRPYRLFDVDDLILKSFVFYFTTAYFMVILPLPTEATLEHLQAIHAQTMNLDPLQVVRTFFNDNPYFHGGGLKAGLLDPSL